jgi:hypothetical protein
MIKSLIQFNEYEYKKIMINIVLIIKFIKNFKIPNIFLYNLNYEIVFCTNKSS